MQSASECDPVTWSNASSERTVESEVPDTYSDVSSYGCNTPEARSLLMSGGNAVFRLSATASALSCSAGDVGCWNGVVVGTVDRSTDFDVEPKSPCNDCDATSIKSRLADVGNGGGGGCGVVTNDAIEYRAAAAADELRRSHTESDVGLCDDVVSRRCAGELASSRSASSLPSHNELEAEVQTSPAVDVLTPRSGAKVKPSEKNEADSSCVDVAPIDERDVKSSVNNERLLSSCKGLRKLSRRSDSAAVKPGVRVLSDEDDNRTPSAGRDNLSDSRTTECDKDQSLANDSSPNTKAGAFEVFIPKNFGRRRLSEEVDYDRHALSFVKRLSTVDADHQLVDVLSPASDSRVPMDFITTSADGKTVSLSSVENDMPESLRLRLSTRAARHRASLHDGDPVNICSTGPSPGSTDVVCSPRAVHDWLANGGLEKDKTNLTALLEKKLSALRQQKQILEEEIQENNSLGLQIKTSAEEKLQSREREKYQQFLRDVDKVTVLLLKLSDMLARAENAVKRLPTECCAKEKERLASKRDDLAQKHEDARLLRADIDERSRSIVNMLHQTLSPAEFSDYEYYILMKSQLAVELQDVEHAIQLGDRQLHLLHSSASALSMPSSDC